MAGIFHGFKVVAAAGTAVPLAATVTNADWINFFPRVTGGNTQTNNVGEIRIGGFPLVGDSGGIPSGSGLRMRPGDSGVAWPIRGLDLRSIYVDADNSGDGVQFVYGEL